jgi:F-type H+-transporting ATPase subunit b
MKRLTLAALLVAWNVFAQGAPAPAATEGTVAHEALAPAAGAEVDEAAPAEHTEGAHEAAHEGHHGPAAIRWLPSDPGEGVPYVYMLMNFAILMAIYVKVGKQPIADALVKRRSDYLAKVDEADRLRREAEARAEKYKSQLATLAQDLAAARTALEEAGKADRQRILTEAQERAERMKHDAAFLVAQEERALRDELQRNAAIAAVEAAAQLLAANVNAADQERLAETFLSGLSSNSLRSGAAQ